MKNKLSTGISIFMCLVLMLSFMTACNFRKAEDDPEQSSITPDESWYPGVDETYEPVTISKVELADIVTEALGEEEAKNFNGDLSTLTEEQIEKVEKVADKRGYVIEKNEQNKPVVKDPAHAEANSEEYNEILSEAGITNATKLSKEEYEKVSKAAADRGMTAVSKEDGGVDIIKPTTTRPPVASTKKTDGKTDKTTKKNSNETTKYVPGKTEPTKPKGTNAAPTNIAAPQGTQLVKTTLAASGWTNTIGGNVNEVLSNSVMASDGSVIAVGTSFSSEGGKASSSTSGRIVKYTAKGKQDWTDLVSGDKTTSFDDVAILKDGSIIAIGTSSATNLADDSVYKCKGTNEGLVVKYTSGGKREWVKLYGGSGGDILYAVEATPDGGFVIGGKSQSSDGDLKGIATNKISAYILKCDANGNIQWKQALSASKHCTVSQLAVTGAGDIYASIITFIGDGDFASIEGVKSIGKTTVAVKYNNKGVRQWTKALYDTGSTELESIAVTKDGGCILAGHYSTDNTGKNQFTFKSIYNGGTPGTLDGVVVKLDATGRILWILPLSGMDNDFVTGIVSVPGGYAVSGYTTSKTRDFQTIKNSGNYDAFVYVISEYGKTQTVSSFGGSGADNARGICGNGSTAVCLCGSTNSGDGYFGSAEHKGNENTAAAFVCQFILNQQ